MLDFLGWQLYNKRIQLSGCFGMLLVDEIEQHLHPKWQRYIVQRLNKQVRNIQFITSTHAPLVAAGLADIDNAQLVRLDKDNNNKIDVESCAD